jgi:tetratricopeptide (TPR) repeat protein
MKSLIHTIVMLVLAIHATGQTATNEIRRGNGHYTERQFGQALEKYAEALRLEPRSYPALYNKAITLARMGKNTEAAVAFAEAEAVSPDSTARANTFYNRGVLQGRDQKWSECAALCKEALRLNPADSLARENLQVALLKLRRQPPKQQRQQPRQQPKKQPSMSREQAEQRLQMLEQKEKQLQQRMRSAKNQGGGSRPKDW